MAAWTRVSLTRFGGSLDDHWHAIYHQERKAPG
jgi:hypothetical protein